MILCFLSKQFKGANDPNFQNQCFFSLHSFSHNTTTMRRSYRTVHFSLTNQAQL